MIVSEPQNHYQKMIVEIAPDANPRHIEAYMRCTYRTLDGLSPLMFKRAVREAVMDASFDTEQDREDFAKSYGL